MTAQHAWVSFKVQDEVGVVKTFDDYLVFEDTTTTLSQLLTYIQATTTILDAMTDGQIIGAVLKINTALVAGLKPAPVAGSDVEESGLITYNTTTPNRSYGEDIPAIAQAVLVGKTIDQAQADAAAWIAHQKNNALAAIPATNRWEGYFETVRSARKTFRKSRKALSRA